MDHWFTNCSSRLALVLQSFSKLFRPGTFYSKKWDGNKIINGEQVRIWMEVDVACFEVPGSVINMINLINLKETNVSPQSG
jgi:hypothetical protein